jgi:hypothetical protein
MRTILLATMLSGGLALAAPPSVPPDLEAWRGWALHGSEQTNCPFLAARAAQEQQSDDSDDQADTDAAVTRDDDARVFRCAWPQTLVVAANAHGATFTQRWELYAESWLVLPGDEEHWPTDVRVNGSAVAVVMRDGHPQMRLPAGSYQLSGSFAWSQRPARLAVAAQTGLVSLSVEGRMIAQPALEGGQLSLGEQSIAAAANALDVQVYRLVEDDIPVRLTTQMRLAVAGEGREVRLSRPLPDGFTPMTLSSELPARLDSDGSLRVQVRPGTFTLTLTARGSSVANTLSRPTIAGKWAQDEIWSFSGVDRLRVATAEGVAGIDPAQAGVPADWNGFPAFRMDEKAVLHVAERSRGLAAADENRLTLNRELWVDFDHEGMTAVDTITGTMRSAWRLQSQAPFRLQSARSGESDLLVTERDGVPGVELRAPTLQLSATSRVASVHASLPASGWDARFEHVRGVLHLPPGHRLLAAPGTDEAPGTWWSRWTLWSLFGVLIVVVFTHRLAGLTAAVCAAAGLLLLYQEAPEYIWLWANVLVAVAVARSALPDPWNLWVRRYRALSFGVLGVALLPLLWGQLRLAIHPQLESAALEAPLYEVVVTARKSEPERARASNDTLEEMVVAAPPPAAIKLDRPPPAAGGAAVLSSRNHAAIEAKAPQPVGRYAPGTVLQTGPGVPSWQYNSYEYSWTGPVESQETARFVFIGPLLLGLWRVLGVALTALWFAWLLQAGFGFRLRLPSIPGAAARAAALLLILACGFTARSEAAATPDTGLLKELRTRLLEAPKCLPNCSEINAARVTVEDNRLELTLQVSALASVAVPMPDAGERWHIDSLAVDGAASLTLGRESDGSTWVPLRAGAHTVRIVARLGDVDSIALAFPQAPRTVVVSASGWEAAGVNDGRLLAGTLELNRRRVSTTHGAPSLDGAQFPAYVKVTRNVQLGIDWSVSTTVERLAPDNAAITMAVPLLAGEAVLTPGVQVRGAGRGAQALAGIAAGAASTSWDSSLARATALELELPGGTARTEVWNFSVSPQWSVAFSGFPAVLPEQLDLGNWVFQYRPRPGEKLRLSIARPAPAAGATLAIDSVTRRVSFGARTVDEQLELRYRSTQGGRHVIGLPADARVQAVRIDNAPVQLRPENGELSISLLPGSHSMGIDWQRAHGASVRSSASQVDLHAPASNISSSIALPQERWPLGATLALAGPVIRYWSELLVFVLSAVLLGRIPRSPLRSHEWLLLGLGLSTQSWLVFVIVSAWLFAMQWRAQWRIAGVSRLVGNLVQVALGVLTVIAVGSLLFSGIRYGFLSAPDMGVAGPSSYGNHFSWFQDQAHGALPEVAVYSIPLWCYKALMFAWALWIAFALTRWLRWAWQAWTSGREPSAHESS